MDNFRHYREFITEHFLVSDKDTQKPVPFRFNKVQNKYYDSLLKDYENFRGLREIILKARQQGLSSFILALFAVDFLMLPHSVSICISHRKDATELLFKKVRFYVESYCQKRGFKLTDLLDTDNRGMLENKINRSTFYVASAGAKVGGRGSSALNLHLSEVSFYPSTDKFTAEEIVLATSQQIPQGYGMIFLETTGNTDSDYFASEWERAERGDSIYKPRFFNAAETYSPEWLAIKEKEFSSKALFLREYPNCLAADTRASDKNGIFVLGEKEKFYQGEDEVYQLKTKLGYTIKATAEHKFMLPSGEWKELKDIEIGETVKLLPPTFSNSYQVVKVDFGIPLLKHSITIDEYLAEFLGIFMGDGCIMKDKYGANYTLSVVFNKKDQDVILKVQDQMMKLFGNCHLRITGTKKGCVEARVSSKYFGELFKDLEMMRNQQGAVKRWIHVPSYILQSPKLVVAAFLRGLIEADGFFWRYSTWPKIQFFTKHEDFMRDIQLLLLGFNITSRISIKNKQAVIKGIPHTYTGRELNLRSIEAERFINEIGFISQRKNNQCINRKTNLKHASGRNRIKRNMEEMVDEVESKICVGRQKVYDMEVIPEHYYSANGFWVHNSVLDAFLSGGTPYFDVDVLTKMLNERSQPIFQGRLSTTGELL